MLAEIATLFLSFGTVAAVKWSGKAAKLAKWLSKTTLAAKASKVAKSKHVEKWLDKTRELFRKKKKKKDTDRDSGGEQTQRTGKDIPDEILKSGSSITMVRTVF